MIIRIRLKSLQDEKVLVDNIIFFNQYHLIFLIRPIEYLGIEQINNDFIASFDFPEEAKSSIGYIPGCQEPLFGLGGVYGVQLQKSNCSDCQKTKY